MPASRVHKGAQPSARRTNEAIDQNNRIENDPEHGQTRARKPRAIHGEQLHCRGANLGEIDILAWEVVATNGLALEPDARGKVLAIESPFRETIDAGHCAFALEDIPAGVGGAPGGIGRIAVGGLAWALIGGGGAGVWASPVAGQTYVLLADAGAWPVIATNDDETYALLQVSGGGGGGGVVQVTALPEHSHGGKGDGGWAGFLSGGL